MTIRHPTGNWRNENTR